MENLEKEAFWGLATKLIRPSAVMKFLSRTKPAATGKLASFGKDFSSQVKWGAGLEMLSGGPSGMKNIKHGGGPYGDIGKTAAFSFNLPKIKNLASRMFKTNTSIKIGGSSKLVGQIKFKNSAPKKINGIIR